MSYWKTKIRKVYQTQGFYRVNLFWFTQTVCIFDGIWNNHANFSATLPPISTSSRVYVLYPCEEQSLPIFYGIATSSRNCKRNRKWHADAAKLMTSPRRCLRPRRVVSLPLTLWGMHQSPVSEKPLPHRFWKGEIETIAAAISIIKHEHNDLFYCSEILWLLLSDRLNDQ